MHVKEFFTGKHIFITGGSGFIGKVLIEKLLRSCDGIEKIYILLRNKKGNSSEERLNIILESEIFDKLKKINPRSFDKLVPINGDVSELKLGLSESDTQTLIENVDIIYHAAASVRFDDHLKDSILLNTRGTREVIEIALRAKKLITFVHISTSFCNCDKIYIEEKIYPAHADWRDVIKTAEQLDQHTFDKLSPKYIHPLPNTYTFAKSLSEHVVNDLCRDKLLATIVRPSVVIPSLDDPVSGWIDNFNGPMGLLSAGGKGILKICYGDINTKLDYVPVDIVIKFIILITYKTALNRNSNQVPVYNTTAGEDAGVTNKELISLGAKLTWDAPYINLFWYPSFAMTNNWFIYYIQFLLYHMIPALFVDGLLKLSGNKPMLIKLQRKVYIANVALIYFMRNTFSFKNQKRYELHQLLQDPESSEARQFSFVYCYDITIEDKYAYYLKSKIASSKVLLKESFDRRKGYINTLILWILNYVVHVGVLGLLGWFFVPKLVTVCCGLVNNYIIYLEKL